MTSQEYYKIIKERWEHVDKNNLKEIKAYNEFKRQLRKELQDGKDEQ